MPRDVKCMEGRTSVHSKPDLSEQKPYITHVHLFAPEGQYVGNIIKKKTISSVGATCCSYVLVDENNNKIPEHYCVPDGTLNR